MGSGPWLAPPGSSDETFCPTVTPSYLPLLLTLCKQTTLTHLGVGVPLDTSSGLAPPYPAGVASVFTSSKASFLTPPKLKCYNYISMPTHVITAAILDRSLLPASPSMALATVGFTSDGSSLKDWTSARARLKAHTRGCWLQVTWTSSQGWS